MCFLTPWAVPWSPAENKWSHRSTYFGAGFSEQSQLESDSDQKTVEGDRLGRPAGEAMASSAQEK